MPRYEDFLRNIVNKVLARHSSRLSPQFIEEVRRVVSRAEDKYKFSVYGGNPVNLYRYLRSHDFRELIVLFKSANATDVLKEILNLVIETYADISEIVEEAKKTINSISGETQGASEKTITMSRIVEELKRLRSVKKISYENGVVKVVGDGYEAVITMEGDRFRCQIRLDVVKKSYEDIMDLLENRVGKIRSLVI